MKIGSLYTVKKFYWLIFPTKEIAAVILLPDEYAAATSPDLVDFWSVNLKHYEVTWFEPNEYIIFLEEDGKYKKVLISDGRIGWTWFDAAYNNCFEEVLS